MSAYTGQVRVDFVHDPTSASFTWVDLTNRGRAAQYRRGRSYERAQVEAGTGSVRLRNDDGALDPTNGASTYSPNVIPFRRFQHNVTVAGPGTVPIFTGLVERWPQEWDTGYGSAPIEVVDIFAWLALGELRSCYEQEVLADSPAAFYPLTEPAGSTTAVDISGNGQSALNIYTFAGGDVTFAAATGIPTDGASTVTVNKTLTNGASDDLNGSYLYSPRMSWGASMWLEAWITVDPNLATALSRNTALRAYILSAVDPATGSTQALFVGYTGGLVKLYDTIGATFVGTDLNDGALHHIAVVHDTVANTRTYYIDGASVFTAAGAAIPGSQPALFVGGFNPTQAGLSPSSGATMNFRGGIGYAAAGSGAPSSARIAAHNTAGRTAFAGETADARIARILRYAGWTATAALDACTTTMLAASDLTGKSALSAIQDVQASEGGVFFASKAGVLTYTSRRTRMKTTASAVTFGENTAGGEIPYVDIALDFDPTYVYNDVQISRTNAATSVSASSSASQAHYGQRTYAATFGTQSDAEAQDAANWILNTSLAPHARVRSVTVDALATPGAFAALLPLEVGSRVTVKRRPNNAAPTITVNSFVESISWDIVDSRRAMCTFELSPIPVQALIADDATYGLCDSTFVAAW